MSELHLFVYALSTDKPEDELDTERHYTCYELADNYQTTVRGQTLAAVTLVGVTHDELQETYPDVYHAIRNASTTNAVQWTERNTREDNTMTDDQIAAVETHNPTVTIEDTATPLATPPAPIPVEDDIDHMTVKQMVRHCTMLYRELTVSLANYASGHDADLKALEVRQGMLADQVNNVENILIQMSTAFTDTNGAMVAVNRETVRLLRDLTDSVHTVRAHVEQSRERLQEIGSDASQVRLELAAHTGSTRGALGSITKALEAPKAPAKSENGWTYVLFLGLGLAIGAAIVFIVG